MAVGSRDHPPMLATGRYPQWRSLFLRYIDTRPYGDALRKYILSGPYKPTTVLVQAVAVTDDSPAIPEHTTEMWEAIKRLQQAIERLQHSESLNIQDVKTNLFWEFDTDEEVVEQELEAHYSYMAKIQEVPTADSGIDSEPLEQVQNDAGYNVFANDLQHSEQSEFVSNIRLVETNNSNVIPNSPDMCEDDIQNDQNKVENDDERVALANLIANLKLDVDEKKDSKAIKESKHNTCSRTERAEFEKYKAFNDRTIDYDKLEQIIDNAWIKHSKDQFRAPTTQDMEILIQTCLMPLVIKTQNDSFLFVHELKQEMHADLKYVESLEREIHELESDKAEFSNMYDMILQEYKNIAISELKKLIEKGKGKSVDTKFDKPSVVRQPNAQRIPKPSVLGKPVPFSNSLERIYFPKTKSVPKTNVSEGLSKPVTAQTLPQIARQVTVRNTNPRVSTSTRVNHKPNVSRPHHKSNQLKDKVLPNNSQVKLKKTQVEVHPRISSVSNRIKSVTACKDSLNSRTLNANVVCATCNKCSVDLNHFACVTKMLNDVNARTKKPNIVPIGTRKPKSQAKKLVATPHKKKVASKPTNQKPQSYFRMLYKQTSKTWKWWIAQQSPLGYKWVPKAKMQWVPKSMNEKVQKRVSFAIDNASRITNVLKRTNSLGSNLSTIPSSFNSLVDCTTYPIHC
nr:hypothetical protein [Tanacetum cinerariifolium]